jgi:predicted nucleic acid-binding protein
LTNLEPRAGLTRARRIGVGGSLALAAGSGKLHSRSRTTKTGERGDAIQLLRLIDELTIELIVEPLGTTATELARKARPHQLTAYDATYLDVANRLNSPLLTLDNNLRAAARRVGVKLVT